MSDDKPSIDSGELENAKSGLSHVEPEKKEVKTRPVFKCAECGETQDIPEDILAKMENDEDVSGALPDHCGQKMKISVTE